MKTFLPILVLAALVTSASGLTIVPTFDSTVTSLSNASTVEAAIYAAIGQYESYFSDNVTINITFQAVSGRSVFGENTENTQNVTFAQIRTALQTHATTSADASSLNYINTDPSSGGSYYLNYAHAKVLGLRAANDPASDGTVLFGTGFNFTYDPNNRAVKGQYDFIGVIEHEVSEVMGRTYGLNVGGGGYTAYDLFRYTSAGTQSVDPNATGVYFSINGGQTNLKGFNSDQSGDLSDWTTTNPYTADSYNAFSNPSVENGITAVDITVMDILGYTPTVAATSTAWQILAGTANPNGTATTAYFQYGLSTSYGFNTPAMNLGNGNVTQTVRYNQWALALGATYHYRLVVDRNGTITNGADQTFTTPSTPPAPTWHSGQVTALTNPLLNNMADGARTGSAHNSWNVYFYKGTDNNLWAVYLTGNAWEQEQLSTDANVSDWVTFIPQNGGLVCYVGLNGKICCVYWNGTKWITDLIGNVPAGVTVAGDLAFDAIWSILYFRGTDSLLHAAHWTGTAWVYSVVGTNPSTNVKGNLLVDPTYHQVYYQGTDNNVWCYSWNGSVWGQFQLTTTPNVGGDLGTDSLPLVVYYRSSVDNSAWCTYWNGSAFIQEELGPSANMSTSATSFSNVAGYDSQYVANYIDTSGAGEALWYNGKAWVTGLLGDGGWNLTGGMSFQPSANFIFARRSDGNVVVFYHE